MNIKKDDLDFNVGNYKSIFNSIPTPIYIWKQQNDDFKLIGYNRSAEIITNGKISDYLNLNLIDVHGADSEVSKDIKKCFYEKINFSKEMLYKHKCTGKQMIHYVTYTYLTPNFVIVYTEDISKQKEAESLLKKAESEKSIILQSISEHIVYQDLNNRIIWTNKAAADSVGLTIDQLIGKKCHKIWNKRDDKCPGCPVISATETCTPTMAEMTTSDGRVWLVKGFPVLNEEGKVVAAVEITNEITKIKQAEEKLKDSELQYRKTIDSMGDAIHVVDKNLRLILINPAIKRWCEILGFETDVLGKKLNEAFPFLSEKILDEYSQVLDSGKILITDEETVIKGTTYFTESRKIPIISKEFVNQIITIIRDISKRKISEKKLKESEKRYREAFNRSNFYKDLFAHDINNIFQNIQSSTELLSLLLDEINFNKGNNFIDIIKDQIIRGTNLISNVRKLSELEEIESPLKKVELFEILDDVKDYIIKSFHNKNINLEICSDEDKIYLNANELLTDVFENILINSIRYNQNSLIELKIKVSKDISEGKKFIRIEFIDNGIGIPNEMKEKVFKRGYNHKGIIKGLGLGLTLVKKIIKIYNGQIWVEDKVQGDYSKGSKFIILIPEVE